MQTLPFYFIETFTAGTNSEGYELEVQNLISETLEASFKESSHGYGTRAEAELKRSDELLEILNKQVKEELKWTYIELKLETLDIEFINDSQSPGIKPFKFNLTYSATSITYNYLSVFPNGDFLVINPENKQIRTIFLQDNRKYFTI